MTLELNVIEYSQFDNIDELAYMLKDDEYLFCEEYLKAFNLADALKAVDEYEPNLRIRAQRILNRPIVQRYIELRRKELKDKYVSKEDIELNLLTAINEAKKKRDYKSVIQGLETLSRIAGYLSPIKNAIAINPPNGAKDPLPPVIVDKAAVKSFTEMFNEEY